MALPPTSPLRDAVNPAAAPLTQPGPVNVLSSHLDATVRQPERLRAVRQTHLLDTEQEESFDRLTRLAAKLIGVPLTFISLVDEERDFYKSCYGFGEPLSSARTIEGRTFCHYALVQSGPLLIPDTLADPAFRDVPTVESLGVRAYAGIPLVTDDGQAIGSFCAVDFAPREWTPLDVEILSELAESALREIKLRSALTETKGQARAAQEATRSREQVLAVVAHDLRTPLNFLKMGTELVGERSGTAEDRDLVRRMESAIEQMSRLIDDLLEVAKIEAGGVLIRPQSMPAETLLNDARDAEAAGRTPWNPAGGERGAAFARGAGRLRTDSPGLLEPGSECGEVQLARRRGAPRRDSTRRRCPLCSCRPWGGNTAGTARAVV